MYFIVIASSKPAQDDSAGYTYCDGIPLGHETFDKGRTLMLYKECPKAGTNAAL
jgi:hypothetical protein